MPEISHVKNEDRIAALNELINTVFGTGTSYIPSMCFLMLLFNLCQRFIELLLHAIMMTIVTVLEG